MSSALYEATVASFERIIDAMLRLLDKAETFCVESALASEEILGSRLVADMRPFTYQVKSTRVHTIGAIEGVRRGSFSPDTSVPPDSFAGLRRMMADTRGELAAVTSDEIDALADRDMVFQAGDYRVGFSGQGFLLSFSVPNAYFHAVTAYGLLRAQGVEVGKVDYLGRVGTPL